MVKEEKIGGLCRYAVESDLRALRDANKIKNDSKRLGAVKKLIQEEMGALEQLASGNSKSFGADYE